MLRLYSIDEVPDSCYLPAEKPQNFFGVFFNFISALTQLKAVIPEMGTSLDATTDKAADLQRFIERARQVTRLTELTPEIVHEFIDKIVVSKPKKIDGTWHQRMAYYQTVRKRQRSQSYAVQIGNLSFMVPAVQGNFLTGAAPKVEDKVGCSICAAHDGSTHK